MTKHLNIFEPYDRKGSHFEDALTRAFLLVIRSVPVAHAAWLHLVDRAHRANDGRGIPLLHELVAPDVRMQTSRVPEAAARVVSVVQTDEHVTIGDDALPSDRRQVLDGVVGYGDLAIVIENKPWHGHIYTEQLEVNLPEGAEHDPRVACVVWSDIVSAWARLLDSGHLQTAESVVIGDFLEYVEEHFPGLRPYSRIGSCGSDHGRLTRRCRALLSSIANPDAVLYHRGWGWYIDVETGQCARKIGLHVELGNRPLLIVEIDPGDTMGQAKILYEQISLADVDALLEQPNWDAWPNFHLLFMTASFFRPGHRHDVATYWRLWARHLDQIRQWKRDEFAQAFDFLLEMGMVTLDHRMEFESLTTATRRPSICFAPGITFQWQLPLDEAARLDDHGKLEDELVKAITQGAQALGLRWPRARV